MVDNNLKRVAILVDTSTGWGRRLIRGVIGYAKKFGPWDLWVRARGQEETMRLPPGWDGDGIIARISDHPTARHVAAQQVPVINVSGIELPGADFPRVTTRLHATGVLAARHLLDCGLKQFVYVAAHRLPYVQHQHQGFAETLAEAGYECESFHPSFGANSRMSWAAQERELGKWLKSLPKPVGVLAWGTVLGRQLIESCPGVGLHVPEDVAVVGGDYDEILCESCTPSLSGVAVPSDQIGYEAAQQLDLLMRGQQPSEGEIRLEPQGVVARQSTDLLAVEDEDVARAIRFIRDNASSPINVQDVLEAVPVSRRRLERGFRKFLGRSPSAEIRRQRMSMAKRLLAETDLAIPEVATRSGFASSTYFTSIFKRELGRSPLKYRSAIRAR